MPWHYAQNTASLTVHSTWFAKVNDGGDGWPK